uniref:Tektin n=1 Tax=Schistosoma haematobium TaxID=6185 RepID=A0A095AJI3_SCHHA
MSTLAKPSIKYQPSDWFTNSFAVSANSQRQREASEQIRQETRSLRLAAALKTKWDEFNNTTRLADRIDAIKDLKDVLELAHSQLDAEISMEKEVIDKSNKRLQQKVDEAFEQIVLLKEARQQILLDLQDKHAAMDIDIQQYKLTHTCPGVSFKLNSTRIPKGTTTPQQWEEFTRYNWRRAQAEIRSGQRLRGAIYLTLCQVSNDLEAQAQATEFALRQRKHDFEQALDELKWQKKQIEDEMAEMENDLDQLEKAIQGLIPMGKLAQTRLERRTYRPGVELCRDSVQYGLTDEVRQIELTNEALLDKQRQARHALNALHKQLNRINDDITLKEESLQIENDCLNLRHQRMDRKQPEKDFNPNEIESHKSEVKLVNKPPTFIERHVAEKLLA